MLSILSSTTSLLDLSIDELRYVSWKSMDLNEFVEELKSDILIKRMRIAMGDNDLSYDFLRENDYIESINVDSRSLYFQFMTQVFPEQLHISEYAFFPKIKYPEEFMEKYAVNSYEEYYAYQDWITPELYEKYKSNDRFSISAFFNNFISHDTVVGGLSLKEWLQYENRKYADIIIKNCELFRFAPIDFFVELNLEVPKFYSTVLTPQRIMAGEPCSSGQRSFTIWLKKYRRVTGDVTGYPTWAALMDIYKKHPRMNQNGYIEWIWNYSLFKTDEWILNYPEKLEVKSVSVSDYIEETEDADISEPSNMITSEPEIDISEEMQVTQAPAPQTTPEEVYQ